MEGKANAPAQKAVPTQATAETNSKAKPPTEEGAQKIARNGGRYKCNSEGQFYARVHGAR
jgi:hypothetical protein